MIEWFKSKQTLSSWKTHIIQKFNLWIKPVQISANRLQLVPADATTHVSNLWIRNMISETTERRSKYINSLFSACSLRAKTPKTFSHVPSAITIHSKINIFSVKQTKKMTETEMQLKCDWIYNLTLNSLGHEAKTASTIPTCFLFIQYFVTAFALRAQSAYLEN